MSSNLEKKTVIFFNLKLTLNSSVALSFIAITKQKDHLKKALKNNWIKLKALNDNLVPMLKAWRR